MSNCPPRFSRIFCMREGIDGGHDLCCLAGSSLCVDAPGLSSNAARQPLLVIDASRWQSAHVTGI